MGRQPAKSVEDKTRIVLAVLRGEITIAAAARREAASEVSISKWRDQFLAGGRQALEAGARHGPCAREQQLAAEIEQLNTALGEAHMELRLWKKGGLAAWSFADLDALRDETAMTVTRFCEVAGIPRPTWYRWQQAGSASKGSWAAGHQLDSRSRRPRHRRDRHPADRHRQRPVPQVWALRCLGRLQGTHRSHPHTQPRSVDQRSHRALLRRRQIRAPLQARHHRRSRARRPGPRLPEDLQHDRAPPSHSHGPTHRPLPTDPDHPTTRQRNRLRFLTRDT